MAKVKVVYFAERNEVNIPDEGTTVLAIMRQCSIPEGVAKVNGGTVSHDAMVKPGDEVHIGPNSGKVGTGF